MGGGGCWIVEITKTMSNVCCAESVQSFNLCHLSREEADLTVNNIALLKKNLRDEIESDAFCIICPLLLRFKNNIQGVSQKKSHAVINVHVFFKYKLI
jgi:hypothetical protein